MVSDILNCLIIIIVVYPVLSAVEHFPIYSRLFAEKKPGAFFCFF